MANTKIPAELLGLNGGDLVLDADGDTKIDAATDDEIHFTVAGSETVYMGVTSYNSSDRIVLTNTGGNASMAIVGSTSGESSIFMADGTSGNASYRGYVQYQHTNDNMNFGTAGSEVMRIDSSGNVGIGRTPSNYSGLSFSAPITDIAGILQTRGGGINIGGSGYRKAGIFTPTSDGDAGNLQFYVAASGSDSSVTEVMRITASGTSITNTGGGTTAANYLKVEGATANNSNYPAIELKGGTLANVYPSYGITNGGLGTWITAGYHTSNYNVRAAWTVNNGTLGGYTSSGTSYTLTFQVDQSGNTSTVGGVVYTLSSDSRVKSDVADLTDGLDILNQLRPVTFKYNTKSEFYSPEDETTTRYGFIADEVKTVAPQYTKEGKGKVDGVEVDDFKTMSQTKMIPMLVKAIQELKAENDSLKTRIETLEG